jgi:hypothetical protein
MKNICEGGGGRASNQVMDMMSHNVYFATRILDSKMVTDTPLAGELLGYHWFAWGFSCARAYTVTLGRVNIVNTVLTAR